MPKKYTVIACLSIAAIFLFLYGFNYGDPNPIAGIKQSSDSKVRKISTGSASERSPSLYSPDRYQRTY